MRLKDTIQDLAEDIANSLLQELRSVAAEGNAGTDRAAEELAADVGKEVAEDMAEHLLAVSDASGNSSNKILERMAALEGKVGHLAEKLGGPAQKQDGTDLSNLKYGKSKYKNVESLLNYIETKEADGGIKLVIMNFND